MVRAFFCGNELLSYITYTNITLIPKKKVVSTLGELRPFSPRTFVNKIISKLIHMRIVEVLLYIFSNNQSRFVKRRSITKNVLLPQKIIRDINKRKCFTI